MKAEMSESSKKQDADRLIDENLRRAYQRKVAEDIPDRLLDIVNKLRREAKTEPKQ